MRKPRPGEVVCQCRAYTFPHRFGGGKCHGHVIVYETWEANWGQGVCAQCNCNDDNTRCQVVDGIETPQSCDAFNAYVVENEVKLVGPYWR